MSPLTLSASSSSAIYTSKAEKSIKPDKVCCQKNDNKKKSREHAHERDRERVLISLKTNMHPDKQADDNLKNMGNFSVTKFLI